MAEITNPVKIQKLKIAGKVVYPATILDAVKDASPKILNDENQEIENPSYGKTLREIIVGNEKVTAAALNELDTRAGKLIDLSTTEKGSLVAAINEVASSTSSATGDLTTLTTDAKTSAVAAINEVDAHADAANAAIAVLNGANTVSGSVAKSVKDAVEALDVTGNVSDAVAGITVKVDEIDGKVQKPVVNVTAGSIAENNESVVTGGTVYTAIEGAKTALIDGATTNGNTLKKVEDRILTIENVVNTDNDTTINKVSEIIDWFNGLPTGSQVATDLIQDVANNKAAIGVVAKDAEGVEGEDGYKAPVAATGLYKYVDDAVSAANSSVDEVIKDLDATAGIASVIDGVVTIKAGLVETDGKIANSTDADITLAKVATTGAAGDVSATAIAASDTLIAFEGTTVEAQLGNAATAIKTVEVALAGKNVSAEGDSYVSASAANNKVTVAATESTKTSLGKANSALQSISKGTDGSFVTTTVSSKSNNSQTVSVAVTTVDSIGTPATATGLVTDKVVYDYALTAVATSDTTEYEDVF